MGNPLSVERELDVSRKSDRLLEPAAPPFGGPAGNWVTSVLYQRDGAKAVDVVEIESFAPDAFGKPPGVKGIDFAKQRINNVMDLGIGRIHSA